MVSDSLKGSQNHEEFYSLSAVTLGAQQDPVDNCSTLSPSCFHDNTRNRHRRLLDLPGTHQTPIKLMETGLQSICLIMDPGSSSEPLACDGNQMIIKGGRTRYDLMQ